MRRGSGGWMDR